MTGEQNSAGVPVGTPKWDVCHDCAGNGHNAGPACPSCDGKGHVPFAPTPPAGMKVWRGGEGPPHDWDRAKEIVQRDGEGWIVRPESLFWRWVPGSRHRCDIMAYTPTSMTDKQNGAPTEMAGWMEWADDRQNSAGVSEIDAVFTFAAMHHYDLAKADAELVKLRARIAALEAHIAAEPDRMREVVERTEKAAFTYAFARGYYYAEETSRQCASAIDDAWDEYAAIRAQEIKPMSDVIQSDRDAALVRQSNALAETLPGTSYWRIEITREVCGGYHCSLITRDSYVGTLASTADLRAKLDVAREALLQSQMMIEQIAHLKSTDFDAVRKRIMANRQALAAIGDGDAENN